MTLFLTAILIVLAFAYINGFHDTGNSIATVVSTRVLAPRMAIVLAASANFIGALFGTAVALTISTGLVDPAYVNQPVVISALAGAVVWNLATWYLGLPTSSSHALFGGLCGATLAAAAGAVESGRLASAWDVILWARPGSGAGWLHREGVWYKILLPMLTSPLLGFLLGMLLMALLYAGLRSWRPVMVNRVFGRLQIVSAAYMGFSHGTNDAQKAMGLLALALVAAQGDGTLAALPDGLDFLRHPLVSGPAGREVVAPWIQITCAVVMAAGTAAGGWRIIRTMGHKMARLAPVHGFAAETAAATVLATAAHFGMPVSTTQVVSASIVGVGGARRLRSPRFTVIERILWAWLLTLPVSAALAYAIQRVWIALAP